MKFIKRYIGDLFLTIRLFMVVTVLVLFFILSFFFPGLGTLPQTFLQVLLILLAIDYFFLFIMNKKPSARRVMAERFSNGDNNKVELLIKNDLPFVVNMQIIDELPEQFQIRDWKRRSRFKAREQQKFTYTLKPVQRGEYHFGSIIMFVSSLLGLLSRRYQSETAEMVPVYPSFMQLRKYELLSRSAMQLEAGTKKMRKIGHSMEFEQIKEYVTGDDIRTLNWKATARKGGLMVNIYTDERSQQVYCLIDKGRLMKMPFSGLTLIDHAINSCLVLSNVCLQKQDKVGLITFSNKIGSILAADKKPIQKDNIMKVLYNQTTDFLESDYEMLYMQVRNRIKHRSLLILFTNFESLSGLRRQLDYLRSLSSHHLLLVIFFENTELRQLTTTSANNIENVYVKTIAEKFSFEKRLIVKELMKYGILSILTTPQNLTIDTVNKYLELKARQAL